MKILVTGGTGYIGSHTVVELLAAGYEAVIVDNLCNSKADVLNRIERIAGHRPDFIQADVRDRAAMRDLFKAHRFDAVIHFAGLKAVGEAEAQPLRYYDNNVTGSLVLFETMMDAGVKTVVFSSSATVYGEPASNPIREDFPLAPANTYGRTKLMIEDMLRDLHRSDSDWRIGLLRYFNPVGAHDSGLIGEDPNGVPNNLMPYIAQVAAGRLPQLTVYGGDYATPDGTGVRDYIHVMDLALGHLAVLRHLACTPGLATVNLGTGQGHSVLEMVHAFERASGRAIPYQIAERRPGDIAAYYADPGLAERLLGWKAARGIAEMCADTWKWQMNQHSDY
ncbi:UDP-galactose 4-epimerase [Sulfuritortus calidifontis]|uniref:UDP-glucose 4-epimerase n=1 Tax=Sulfuritortus calidifontis TaxID=1914471 RepID=A0A4R3JYF7_9PROT|nr:UDP-glucose 4-epimerase GalE [Sulfuritortus calidifontis]TCS71931.1 UDP-galactose 4-epimerase [Sulfuritortus calidifontis]